MFTNCSLIVLKQLVRILNNQENAISNAINPVSLSPYSRNRYRFSYDDFIVTRSVIRDIQCKLFNIYINAISYVHPQLGNGGLRPFPLYHNICTIYM